MVFNKQVRIDGNVPMSEAINAIRVYIQELPIYPWKNEKMGERNGILMVFGDNLKLFVYQTETCYIVRRGY